MQGLRRTSSDTECLDHGQLDLFQEIASLVTLGAVLCACGAAETAAGGPSLLNPSFRNRWVRDMLRYP
jgi:hypothetical protein